MLKIRAIVCMGVSGCGKTTVAKALAEQLAYQYHDADNYHPESNKVVPDDLRPFEILCLIIPHVNVENVAARDCSSCNYCKLQS